MVQVRPGLAIPCNSNKYSIMTARVAGIDYRPCWEALLHRLGEPAPGCMQLVAGPRQCGKTTLLRELADAVGPAAVYAAADAPDAAAPGFWYRQLTRLEDAATRAGKVVLLLDAAHVLEEWPWRLLELWERFRQTPTPLHVVAAGSFALHHRLDPMSPEALRFERLWLRPWSASTLAEAFGVERREAALLVVRRGALPGAFFLQDDPARWATYVREAVLEPALGRDLDVAAGVRRPALMRQLLGVAAASPASILSLQKLQARLPGGGALETIAHYLSLLEQAGLVAPLPRYPASASRRRAAPPKLVTLDNALLSVAAPHSIPEPAAEPIRFARWVENACLAHAWASGQQVSYWREEPFEVAAVVEGSWGRWAVEVKPTRFDVAELAGLRVLAERHPGLTPLVVCGDEGRSTAERAGFRVVSWRELLLDGPPGRA
jgi:predicted AAA+ superfamily ATPase